MSQKQVLFESFPKQLEFLEAIFSGNYNFILYGGAIRGGKTFGGIAGLLLLSKMYPNSKWCILRDSLATLKRTTIPSFFKLCPKSFIKSYNQDTQTVTFRNGSQILFFGENYYEDKELNRMKGLEVNGFLLEEINELQKVTFLKCIERAGSHVIPNVGKMPKPIILGTCNPANNWVKEDVYNLWRNNELPPSWKYISSKISDNPYISEEYKESLKMLPEHEYDVFVNGNWDLIKVENPFFHAFNPIAHVSKEAIFDPKKQLFISIDFNLNPFGCIFGHIFKENNKECAYIFDELSISNGSIPAMIDAIKERYSGQLSTCFITGDAMGNRGEISQRDNASLYMQLQRGLGISVKQLRVTSNPTHENSRVECNFALKNIEKLLVHPDNCKGLVRDFRIVQCDAFGGIIKRNRKDISQQADLADCFRYFIHSFLGKWVYDSMVIKK